MSLYVFLRASAVVLLCGLTPNGAWAQDQIEDLELLKANAQEALIAYLNQNVQASGVESEVKMLPLDPRLRLSQCNAPIEHQISVPPTNMGLATVKIMCEGSARWTIYAPAHITLFGQAAVATKSLARGRVIQPDDFHYVRQNLNLAGGNYIGPTNVIVGQELKRQVTEGEPLRMSYLEMPKIIQRGDRVTLEAQTNGLSVAAPGMAMANGKVGERIQVRNAQSNRIIDALVIAPGRVRVRYE